MNYDDRVKTTVRTYVAPFRSVWFAFGVFCFVLQLHCTLIKVPVLSRLYRIQNAPETTTTNPTTTPTTIPTTTPTILSVPLQLPLPLPQQLHLH